MFDPYRCGGLLVRRVPQVHVLAMPPADGCCLDRLLSHFFQVRVAQTRYGERSFMCCAWIHGIFVHVDSIIAARVMGRGGSDGKESVGVGCVFVVLPRLGGYSEALFGSSYHWC